MKKRTRRRGSSHLYQRKVTVRLQWIRELLNVRTTMTAMQLGNERSSGCFNPFKMECQSRQKQTSHVVYAFFCFCFDKPGSLSSAYIIHSDHPNSQGSVQLKKKQKSQVIFAYESDGIFKMLFAFKLGSIKKTQCRESGFYQRSINVLFYRWLMENSKKVFTSPFDVALEDLLCSMRELRQFSSISFYI